MKPAPEALRPAVAPVVGIDVGTATTKIVAAARDTLVRSGRSVPNTATLCATLRPTPRAPAGRIDAARLAEIVRSGHLDEGIEPDLAPHLMVVATAGS
jgi:hypothetical protein